MQLVTGSRQNPHRAIMDKITAAQFALTLENMSRSWSNIPEEERQPASQSQSFFEDYRQSCEQMISRWNSGQSSHPDAAQLADIYRSDDPTSVDRLYADIWELQEVPEVQEAEQRLRAAMYTAYGEEAAAEDTGGSGGAVLKPGDLVEAFWPDETQEGGGMWMAASVHEMVDENTVTIVWDEDGSASQLTLDYIRYRE